MNNKGFTLIEIIGVITIIAIVIVLATPAINSINNGIQENMLEKKIKFIELAGKSYGGDYRSSIENSTKKYEGHKCIKKTVKDLVLLDYLDKETKEDNSNYIEDPTDKENYLDNDYVIIYFESLNEDNNLSEINAKYYKDYEEDLCK